MTTRWGRTAAHERTGCQRPFVGGGLGKQPRARKRRNGGVCGTVELFFRVLKQLLGLRHLIGQREQAIDIQVYCTLIVCLLIQSISGKKPNKAMRNIVGWYLIGLATVADVVAFINRPDNTGVKLRAKEALWKKLGY